MATPIPLNLFPSKVFIGGIENGKVDSQGRVTGNVLISNEFLRALQSLVERVGGASGTDTGGSVPAGTSGGVVGYVGTNELQSSALLNTNAIVLGGGSGATPTTPIGLGASNLVLHGNASGAPFWGIVTGADITPAALTKVDDTNVTLTLGGTPTEALIAATSLTLGWTGQLSGERGGTGVNNTGKTITLGGSLTTAGAFDATFTMTGATSVTFPTSGTLATVAATVTSITGTADQVLANGTSGSAEFGAVTLTLPQSIAATSSPTFTGLNLSGLTASKLVATDGSKNLSSADLTGDVTSSGLATTVVKINGVALGTTTATSGNLLIGSGTEWVTNAMSGDITINSTGVTAIGALKVTNAMIANSTIDLTTKVTGILPNANTTAASANTASAIVTRDSNGDFSARTITMQNFSVSFSGVVQPQITSTTSGSTNAADLVLQRGDVANGYCRIINRDSGGVLRWASGMFLGDSTYRINDQQNAIDVLTITAGATPITTIAGTVNLTGLTASSLVATDSSKNLTSSTSSLSPTFAGLTITGTGTVSESITTTTTGSANAALLKLTRGDQSNGFAQVRHFTGATENWRAGTMATSPDYVIYDAANSQRLLTATQGADNAAFVTIIPITTSSSTSTGSLINSGGFGNAGNAHIGGTIFAPKLTLNNAGSIASPAVGFLSDATGIYQYSAGELGFAANGTFVARMTDAMVQFAQPHILRLENIGTVSSGASNALNFVYVGGNGAQFFDADGSFTFFQNVKLDARTASQAVVTDASKNLASLEYTASNTASTLVLRDGSGNFSAGTITATLSGPASLVTTAADTSDTTAYVTFVNASSGNQAVKLNTNLIYNSSLGLFGNGGQPSYGFHAQGNDGNAIVCAEALVGGANLSAYLYCISSGSIKSIFGYRSLTGYTSIYHNGAWDQEFTGTQILLNKAAKITDTTASTSITTGSGIFAGGVGISGALFADTAAIKTGGNAAAYDTCYLQVGPQSSDIASYSPELSSTCFTSKTTNGGSTPASPESVSVWMRQGVAGQAYANIADWKLSRTANVSTNANSRLTLGLTGGAGDSTTTTVMTWDNLNGVTSAAIAGTLNVSSTITSTGFLGPISMADETSDTTCFPMFSTASGSQTSQPKTDPNLTYNSSTETLGFTNVACDNINNRQLVLDASWTDEGAITFTGVTSNPGYTASTNKIFSKRLGDIVILWYQFQMSATGAIGSGDYLLSLPYTMHSDMPVSTTASASGEKVDFPKCQIGTGWITNNSARGQIQAIAYSTTKFRLAATVAFSGLRMFGNGSAATYDFAAANVGIGLLVMYRVNSWDPTQRFSSFTVA